MELLLYSLCGTLFHGAHFRSSAPSLGPPPCTVLWWSCGWLIVTDTNCRVHQGGVRAFFLPSLTFCLVEWEWDRWRFYQLLPAANDRISNVSVIFPPHSFCIQISYGYNPLQHVLVWHPSPFKCDRYFLFGKSLLLSNVSLLAKHAKNGITNDKEIPTLLTKNKSNTLQARKAKLCTLRPKGRCR